MTDQGTLTPEQGAQKIVADLQDWHFDGRADSTAAAVEHVAAIIRRVRPESGGEGAPGERADVLQMHLDNAHVALDQIDAPTSRKIGGRARRLTVAGRIRALAARVRPESGGEGAVDKAAFEKQRDAIIRAAHVQPAAADERPVYMSVEELGNRLEYVAQAAHLVIHGVWGGRFLTAAREPWITPQAVEELRQGLLDKIAECEAKGWDGHTLTVGDMKEYAAVLAAARPEERGEPDADLHYGYAAEELVDIEGVGPTWCRKDRVLYHPLSDPEGYRTPTDRLVPLYRRADAGAPTFTASTHRPDLSKTAGDFDMGGERVRALVKEWRARGEGRWMTTYGETLVECADDLERALAASQQSGTP